MFTVDPKTKTINMTCGDTGSISYVITGVELDPNDTVIALWTMIDIRNGTVVKQEACEVDSTTYAFSVDFENSDTDSLTPGNYMYDIRVVINPDYDQEDDTKIVDGDAVKTPIPPTSIILTNPIGRI